MAVALVQPGVTVPSIGFAVELACTFGIRTESFLRRVHCAREVVRSTAGAPESCSYALPPGAAGLAPISQLLRWGGKSLFGLRQFSGSTLMSLSDLASLGSFISGIAVLFSFVFLALQIRQNASNQRAIIHNERARLVQDLTVQSFGTYEGAETMLRGNAADVSLDSARSRQYLAMLLSVFRLFEEFYYQHRDGMIDEARWHSNTLRMHGFLAIPGMRAGWRTHAPTFGADFRAWMDRILRKVAIDTHAADVVATWKGFCGEECAAAD